MAVATKLVEPDELITLIYKGPLEPVPWSNFLSVLGPRMRSESAAMVLRLSKAGVPPRIIWGSRPAVDEASARRLQIVHAELGHLDPLRNALQKPGDIHVLDEVISREELHDNPFYRNIMKPYGIEFAIGMYISEPGGWECNVGLTNGPGASNFGTEDKEMLQTLRPHLEQALALYSRLRRDESELQILTETLDRLTICTFILDRLGRVERCNSAATQLLTAGEPFRTVDGKLILMDRVDNAAFQSLIEHALTSSASPSEMGYVDALRVESVSQRHVGVLVRAIDGNSAYGGEVGPAAAVYVAGFGQGRPLERLVGQLFDLTPSEARLATLLAEGCSLGEAAETLGLTENTVRSYCKTVLNKTGVSRQADLVRLILRSVAVLG